jgi:hypothetical protein
MKQRKRRVLEYNNWRYIIHKFNGNNWVPWSGSVFNSIEEAENEIAKSEEEERLWSVKRIIEYSPSV